MSPPTITVSRAKDEQDGAKPLRMDAECLGKDDGVNANDRIQTELHHDARKEHANRSRSDRVGIGQPEMKGHDRRLDEKPASQQSKGEEHQGIMARAQIERPICAMLSAPVTA